MLEVCCVLLPVSVVEQLSDIDWLPSDDSDDEDDDEPVADNDRPAAAAADDDDGDLPSIDVQDSPVVSGVPVQMTKTLLPACLTHAQVGCLL